MPIADMKANEMVEEEFIVREKSLREFRSGQGRYLSLVLGDPAGQTIEARAWDRADELEGECQPGDIVLIQGQASEYKGQMQLKITSLIKRTDPDLSRFVNSLPSQQISDLAERLKGIIDSVQDRHLRALLSEIFDDKDTWQRFCTSTAAKSLHSAYLGGLLEHTVNVVSLAESLCTLYPDINRDLLVSGAILHDIGKIDTFELRGALFEYTEEGKLIGEPVLGERRLLAAMNRIDGFPLRHRNILSHMILSHHGEYQFGAPILPSCLEAFALHLVDNLEAKVNTVHGLMTKETDPEKAWSEYHRTLQRSFYLLRLDEEEQEPHNS